MPLKLEEHPLARGALRLRFAALLALAGAALLLRAVPPESVSWLPLRTSCGAVSGLPCIFCGTTRALHHLLNGDFAGALYFNWLAFPVTALAILLAGKWTIEVVTRRRLPVAWPRWKLTPASLAAGLGSVFALWIFQVAIAVGLHKHELLNSQGPLYALFLH